MLLCIKGTNIDTLAVLLSLTLWLNAATAHSVMRRSVCNVINVIS